MSDIRIPGDGGPITDETGAVLLDKERSAVDFAARTASHPPIPGLAWQPGYGLADGGGMELRGYDLIVKRDWYDAFAPPVDKHPLGIERHGVVTDENRLGALAYQGWRSVLPDIVREAEAPWTGLPLAFRRPMISAAVTVWQHGENAGYHTALQRTLPSAQFGAAGEIDNLADHLGATFHRQAGVSAAARDMLMSVMSAMRERAAELRKEARR